MVRSRIADEDRSLQRSATDDTVGWITQTPHRRRPAAGVQRRNSIFSNDFKTSLEAEAVLRMLRFGIISRGDLSFERHDRHIRNALGFPGSDEASDSIATS